MNYNLNSHYICSLTTSYINCQKTLQEFQYENVGSIKPQYYSSLKQVSWCCTRLCH